MGPGYYDLYYGGFSPLYYIAMLALLAFSLYAQIRVKTSFSKYSAVHCRSGMTGAQAAQAILRANGITDVRIEPISGDLTDHYDPRAKVIRLSERVYGADTVAAVGVASHEAGHAVQYATGYAPVRLRAAIIGVTSFASRFAMLLFIGGLILCAAAQQLIVLAYIGFFLYCTIFFFQLVTLPVEFNASRRAMAEIAAGGTLTEEERRGARRVLTAAALTYVAAMLTSLLQVLRLLSILRRNDRDR